MGKAARRAAQAWKRRYGPRGGASDRRPIVVIEDRGLGKRMRKALERRAV